jgi:hypothetical protein
MADASAGISALIESDLTIEIAPGWAPCFRGSSAQLLAEGLIPKDFIWPHRTQPLFWEDGQFEYFLKRCRPAGIKGPQSIWVDGDYWLLEMSVIGFDYSVRAWRLAQRVCAEGRVSLEPAKASKHIEMVRSDEKYWEFRRRLFGEADSKRARSKKSA